MVRNDKRGIGTAGAILAIAVIVIIAIALFYPTIQQTLSTWQSYVPGGPTSTSTPPPQPGGRNLARDGGIVTMGVNAYDSLDIATSRTVGSDINVYWYALRGGQWQQLGSGNDADVSLLPSDNAQLFMVVSYPSSASYYFDEEKTLLMNSFLSFYSYEDVTGDNKEDYILKVDLSKNTNYADATGKWIPPDINIYLLTYDSSFAIPTGGKPSDISGCNSSNEQETLFWYAEISAEKKAYMVYKVVLTLNTSDTSKVRLVNMEIPGLGYISGSSFERDELSDSIKYTYEFSSTSLHGAHLLTRPVNDPNRFEFTTILEFNLSSGDVIQATLYIYGLTPNEASVSDSDSVVITYA